MHNESETKKDTHLRRFATKNSHQRKNGGKIKKRKTMTVDAGLDDEMDIESLRKRPSGETSGKIKHMSQKCCMWFFCV